MERARPDTDAATVRIPSGTAVLWGELRVPRSARGLTVLAHDGSSGRHGACDQAVARTLEEAGLATLLTGLLTEDEVRVDEETRHLRFDVGLLAGRVADVVRWAETWPATHGLRVGLFGAGAGAAAALVAAARAPDRVAAVVSRGARPDLASPQLRLVRSPTLLLVGGADGVVLDLNESAFRRISCEKALRVVARATHRFEEPGAPEEVARQARSWFLRHLDHPHAPETKP
jgi:pimeloyl-ACP methyl ester carboxylesterase